MRCTTRLYGEVVFIFHSMYVCIFFVPYALPGVVVFVIILQIGIVIEVKAARVILFTAGEIVIREVIFDELQREQQLVSVLSVVFECTLIYLMGVGLSQADSQRRQ